ncbi:unnamed protein product [Acanthoscelides obtectus]|uniref:Uncharacterized protein n=1 Tax=Acanthoscelides obtectus TaxID=200917 RepID=A0A9P0Q378_ACAOB|nr:unnamed protein product [Acanthoscelides obtectus]CAK1685729.1 hypothetical protein AOBTE_LOCUS35572 [Acanthoscelides obtectus]
MSSKHVLFLSRVKAIFIQIFFFGHLFMIVIGFLLTLMDEGISQEHFYDDALCWKLEEAQSLENQARKVSTYSQYDNSCFEIPIDVDCNL